MYQEGIIKTYNFFLDVNQSKHIPHAFNGVDIFQA